MKVTELKKNLSNLTKDELIRDIADLFKKNPFVKDYYIAKYESKNSAQILSKYKLVIKNEFFPERGFGKERLSVAKKAITEFSKISNNKELISELMIYYVEMGVEYTNTYGDITESFYNSMEGMYESALKQITNEDLTSKFKERCLKIVTDTKGIGWGFHDGLAETYATYIGL